MSEIELTPLRDLINCGDYVDYYELTKQFIINSVVVDSRGNWYIRNYSYGESNDTNYYIEFDNNSLENEVIDGVSHIVMKIVHNLGSENVGVVVRNDANIQVQLPVLIIDGNEVWLLIDNSITGTWRAFIFK